MCLSHTSRPNATNIRSPKPPPPFIPSFEQLRIARRDRDAEINSRLRGPPLPDRLSPEDDTEVSRLLNKRGVVAKVARLQITDADLSRLRPGTWLNDEIVNFYGQLILERSEANPRSKGVKNGARSEKNMILNVHYFNSFFFTKLSLEGYERGRLGKWTKKVWCHPCSTDKLLNDHYAGSLTYSRKTLHYCPLTTATRTGQQRR